MGARAHHIIFMPTIMKLSITMSLLAHVSRFVILALATAMALPPKLPSQSAKE
jgi:hypothetical protein